MNRRDFFVGLAASLANARCAMTPEQRSLYYEQAELNSMAMSRDPALTIKYDQLMQRRPDLHLDRLRKTVGLVQFENTFGSVILIDKVGTLVGKAHASISDELSLNFSPSLGVTSNSKALVREVDKIHDIAFWQMRDPELIEKNGLLPVDWKNAEYEADSHGRAVQFSMLSQK